MKLKFSLLLIVIIFGSNIKSFTQTKTPDYTIKPNEFVYKGITFYQLPYAFNALEPVINKIAVFNNYNQNFKTYFTKYMDSMAGKPEIKIEELFKKISKYSFTIKNNAGGYYNNMLYYQEMIPGGSALTKGKLSKAISKKFGSMDKMMQQVLIAAITRYGDGWVWISVDEKHELFISSTTSNENPLMDVVKERGTPIFTINLWENAYYLNYHYKRKEYIDNFWKVVNWNEVEKLYDSALKN